MSTTSPSLERAEYIMRFPRVKHYLRGRRRFFMFFEDCPRFRIKQNIGILLSFIIYDIFIILLSTWGTRLPVPRRNTGQAAPDSSLDSRHLRKGLAAGAESPHIHFRKTGGHIYRQSGQGREAATVTNSDMGRSVFHLLPTTFPCLRRNKTVDGRYDIWSYYFVLRNRGI